jgi:hypothetical protein
MGSFLHHAHKAMLTHEPMLEHQTMEPIAAMAHRGFFCLDRNAELHSAVPPICNRPAYGRANALIGDGYSIRGFCRLKTCGTAECNSALQKNDANNGDSAPEKSERRKVAICHARSFHRYTFERTRNGLSANRKLVLAPKDSTI